MLPKTKHGRIFLGLLLGAIFGGIAQAIWGAENAGLKGAVDNIFRPGGQIFMNLIFMMVVPLIFSALVLGVAEIGDIKKVGRIGIKSLLLTCLLSGIAVLLGVGLVSVIKPGAGITPTERARLTSLYGDVKKASESVENAEKTKSVGDTIADFIPKNPLSTAVDALGGGILPFMVFSLIFGLALAGIEAEKALPVTAFLEGLFAVSLRVIDMAMSLAPIGVFCLVFAAASQLGVQAIQALGQYAFVVLLALAIQLFVVYSLVIKFLIKQSPIEFFRKIRGVMATAFATSSSNATLPTALETAEQDLGLPRSISSFVLTIGATANQNGTALFEGVTVLFLAQVFGVPLGIGEQVTVMLMCIVAGIGTAGVPGGSWPMIALILMKIGVPAEAIGLCLGIDRILDMSRTVFNVTGDITIAAAVSASEANAMPATG